MTDLRSNDTPLSHARMKVLARHLPAFWDRISKAIEADIASGLVKGRADSIAIEEISSTGISYRYDLHLCGCCSPDREWGFLSFETLLDDEHLQEMEKQRIEREEAAERARLAEQERRRMAETENRRRQYEALRTEFEGGR